MKALEAGYTYEVDNINSDLWNELILHFEDASLYQTWSYGIVHSGEKSLSHIVLKKNDTFVGMAQARIAKLPGLPVGIAYINKPMWKAKNEKTEVGHIMNMGRALYNEYVLKRKYYLRIIPNLIDSTENAWIKDVFHEEGFSHSQSRDQTVVLDLSPPLEDIRRNLSRKWRQTLQRGEKNEMGILEGKDEKLCQMALDIFREMKDRKGFFGEEQAEAIKVHKKLPENLKLNFMVCTDAGEPIAALAWVTFGSTGLPLVSATGSKALRLNAAYVLWWKMIQYYKVNGFSALDVGGVNEERNPGGYYFKTHILGKGFKGPNRYFGQFDACRNPLSRILFKGIFAMRDRYRDEGRKMAKPKGKAEIEE